MNLILEPPEDHRFIHFLAGIDPFKDQMAKGIRDVDEAPPGVSPLNSSSEIKGMLRLLKDIEEDKD